MTSCDSSVEHRQEGSGLTILALPLSKHNLPSVSATKNGLEPACRTVKRDRGTNRLTTPASPVRDRTSTLPGYDPGGESGFFMPFWSANEI